MCLVERGLYWANVKVDRFAKFSLAAFFNSNKVVPRLSSSQT